MRLCFGLKACRNLLDDGEGFHIKLNSKLIAHAVPNDQDVLVEVQWLTRYLGISSPGRLVQVGIDVILWAEVCSNFNSIQTGSLFMTQKWDNPPRDVISEWKARIFEVFDAKELFTSRGYYMGYGTETKSIYDGIKEVLKTTYDPCSLSDIPIGILQEAGDRQYV